MIPYYHMGQGLILHQAEAQTDAWKDSIKERDHSLWQLAVTPLLHWECYDSTWRDIATNTELFSTETPCGRDRHRDNQLEANSPHLSSSQQSQAWEGAVFLRGLVVGTEVIQKHQQQLVPLVYDL